MNWEQQTTRWCRLHGVVAFAAIIVGLLTNCYVTVAEEQIERLGSDRFSDRQSAMQQLWASREEVQRAVEAAEKAGDAETAARARWILEQWNLGVTPQTPPELRRTLLSASQSNDPEELLALVLQGTPEPLLQRIRNLDQLAVEFGGELLDHFWMPVAASLFSSGKAESLVELYDHCASTPRHAVMRSELLRSQGASPERINQLPQAARNWKLADRQRAEIWLADMDGDFEATAALATRYGNEKMLAGSYIKADRWQELADLAVKTAKTRQAKSSEHAMWWTLALAAARQLDRGDIYDEALHELHKFNAKDAGAHQASWGLLLDGDFDRAIGLINDNQWAVVDLLSYLQRYPQAFDRLGVHPQSLERDLQKLTEQAIQAAKKSVGLIGEPPDEWKRALYAAQFAYFIGFHREATDAFKQLARVPDFFEVGADSERDKNTVLRYVLRYLPESADNLQYELVAQRLDSNATKLLAEILPNTGVEAELVWHAMAEVFPKESALARVHFMVSLFAGKLPDGWTHHGTLDQIAEILRRLLDGDADSKNEGGYSNSDTKLSRLFQLVGRSDLASYFGKSTDFSQLRNEQARAALDRGDYATAIQLYRHGFNSDPEGNALSLIGWTVSLRRSGQVDDADALEHVIKLLPLHPSSERNQAGGTSLSQVFDEFNFRTLADKYRQEMWRTSEPNGPSNCLLAFKNSLAVDLSAEERGKWYWRSIFSSLLADRGNPLPPKSFIAFCLRGAIAAGEAAVKRDEFESAQRWLRCVQQLYPGEINIPQDLTPLLNEKGQDKLAKLLVDKMVLHYEDHLKNFPHDPTVSNNLAWAMSLNDYRMDRALELSQQAVRWVPDSTAYRDTLAEILFRRGDVEQAILIEQQCLIDTPDDWHLHKQIRRFQQKQMEHP